MNETQEEGKAISWEDAKNFDELSNKYFTAKPNVDYKLTIKSYRLVRKQVQDYKNKDVTVEKTVLELVIDSINGNKVEQQWNVLSFKLRQMFEPYAKAGLITQKVFLYNCNGLMGQSREYTLAALEPRVASVAAGASGRLVEVEVPNVV
jgi:hypothetical protein